ncbi:MAG: CRISPR-associated helicase Cas3' [Kineosporiaceae bacterium]
MTDTYLAWGKTGFDPATKEPLWLPLSQHLTDSGAAAGMLWDGWLSPGMRTLLAAPFGDLSHGRAVARFLAAVHDVGKATPAFAVQARRGNGYLLDLMAANGLQVDPRLPPEASRELRHALAGQLILQDWLVEQGWDRRAAAQLAVVIGGHHGIPPDRGDLLDARQRRQHLGEGPWRAAQRHLIDCAARASGTEDLWPIWASIMVSQPAQVALTGLVIMADWIASNAELFPLLRESQDRATLGSTRQRAEAAMALLDLPAAWHPNPGRTAPDERLAERFGITAGARPVQTAALAAAEQMPIPGIMVIEAAMGEGKTEAALLAAEVLAHRSGAGGCFVALPTQATTDAMFARVLDWLDRLPDDAAPGARPDHSVVLAHGKSRLNPTYRDLFRLGRPSDIASDESDGPTAGGRHHACTVQAYIDSWTTGRKKGSLADFVVGTVDQLLFVALKARHLALRHLGIARKVVIVDEVHAYDAYMNVYLTRALEWLGAYGVPVILLSATLPPQRRADLCEAYRKGLASHTPPAPTPRDWDPWADGATSTAPQPTTGISATTDPVLHYPVITWAGDRDAGVTPVPRTDARHIDVAVETMPDDLDQLTARLDRELVDGGCALVVRNTVRRAQETAEHLARRFGGDVRLVHARFMGHHRMANDAWLRSRFGPPGTADRPERLIVVGTQVVEQSLDIDFDLLITDLAPIDLVLQRIGRMHRHRRGPGEADRPERLRRARCLVTGVTAWDGEPPTPVDGSARVYGHHLLHRSAWPILEAARTGTPWHLPRDIPLLVAQVYAETPIGPGTWQEVMHTAQEQDLRVTAQRRQHAQDYLLSAPGPPGEPILGWLYAHVGEADDDTRGRAAVRDGDDSVEVLLLRRHPDGSLHLPDGEFPAAGALVEPQNRPAAPLAQALAGCSLRLPSWATAGPNGAALMDALHENWFRPWQDDDALRGQLVLILDRDGLTRITGLSFTYDAHIGLEVRRDGS